MLSFSPPSAAGALAQHGAVPGEAPAPGLLPLQARDHDSEGGWHMSVAGAGGRADTGAHTAGVHASNGREVGVVEDRELEGQPALDAAGKRDTVSGGCSPESPLLPLWLIYSECRDLCPLKSKICWLNSLNLQTQSRHLTGAHRYLLSVLGLAGTRLHLANSLSPPWWGSPTTVTIMAKL